MSLIIARIPCYKCGSDKEKLHPNCASSERLTRCVGCDYIIRFYSEGLTKDEYGHDAVADWVFKQEARVPLQRCNAVDSGVRYFHQSCLGRDEPSALSRANGYYSIRGKIESEKYPELRNITHKCCEDCVIAAQTRGKDLNEDKLNFIMHQGVIGRSQ